MTPHVDAVALSPEIVVTATLAIVFIIDLFVDDRRRSLLTALTFAGLTVAFVTTVLLGMSDRDISMLNGSYVTDELSLLAKALFIGCTLLVLLLGVSARWKGEYLTLILSSLLGMMLVVSARDLVLFFVAFELFAIPGYLLTGWRKQSRLGHEGILKYYLLGVLATAIMLYGLSLLFGIAGGTSFERISVALSDGGSDLALARLGVLFVIVGLAFKVSAVPFHFWSPDAYQSAPIPVAAFLSVATKAAGMVSLLVVTLLAFGTASDIWAPLLTGLAVVTMTVGNVVALRQTDLVRLLAYSSIAQAGYLLVPLAVTLHYGGEVDAGLEATLEYLAIYVVMNIAAFAAVIGIAKRTHSTSIDAANGLFTTAPALAMALSVAMFSLAGMPPFAGWFAKFVVFKAAIDAGSGAAIALVAVAAINTAIGLVYYANVVRHMWLPPTPTEHVNETATRLPNALVAVLGITSVAIVVVGVLPGIVTELGSWTSISR